MIYKEFEWRDVVKRSLYAVFMIIPMQFLRYLLWEITHKGLYFSDFWKEAINGSGFSDLFTLLGICFATSFLISTTSLSSLPEFFLIRICKINSYTCFAGTVYSSVIFPELTRYSIIFAILTVWFSDFLFLSLEEYAKKQVIFNQDIKISCEKIDHLKNILNEYTDVKKQKFTYIFFVLSGIIYFTIVLVINLLSKKNSTIINNNLVIVLIYTVFYTAIVSFFSIRIIEAPKTKDFSLDRYIYWSFSIIFFLMFSLLFIFIPFIFHYNALLSLITAITNGVSILLYIIVFFTFLKKTQRIKYMITQSIKNAILNIRDSVIYNTQLLIDREINSKQVYLKNSQQIFSILQETHLPTINTKIAKNDKIPLLGATDQEIKTILNEFKTSDKYKQLTLLATKSSENNQKDSLLALALFLDIRIHDHSYIEAIQRHSHQIQKSTYKPFFLKILHAFSHQ